MNGIFLWVLVILLPIALIAGAVIGYLAKQTQIDKAQQIQKAEVRPFVGRV